MCALQHGDPSSKGHSCTKVDDWPVQSCWEDMHQCNSNARVDDYIALAHCGRDERCCQCGALHACVCVSSVRYDTLRDHHTRGCHAMWHALTDVGGLSGSGHLHLTMHVASIASAKSACRSGMEPMGSCCPERRPMVRQAVSTISHAVHSLLPHFAAS
jgi:hypothetical protein